MHFDSQKLDFSFGQKMRIKYFSYMKIVRYAYFYKQKHTIEVGWKLVFVL